MNERLYIKKIQEELQYRDRRSVRRWCRNNNVRILSDAGSNRLFVLRDEFEKAKSQSYHVCQRILSTSINFLSQNSICKAAKVKVYRPQGAMETKFLSILQKI
jgi:hypothetical protein